MNAVELLKAATGRRLHNAEGATGKLRLLPPLSEAELKELEGSLPCPLPDDARELLALSRGIEGMDGFFGPVESIHSIDFSGKGFGEYGGAWVEGLLPYPMPIAHDGCGNYWELDITPESKHWGPVYYVCHDPATMIYQCEDVATFIQELLRAATPPFESAIKDVEEATMLYWHEHRGAIPREAALSGADRELRAFAETLEAGFFIVDWRHAKPGDGMTLEWMEEDALRRLGWERVFAYRPTPRGPGLWSRLRSAFGR